MSNPTTSQMPPEIPPQTPEVTPITKPPASEPTTMQKGCGGCGCLVMLIFAVFLLKACWSDSGRNSELASTTDPARIAFLHLDHISEDAQSSTQRQGDHVQIEFRLDPWALTASSSKSSFFSFSKQIIRDTFAKVKWAKSITIVGTGSFTDLRGNSSRGRVFELEFTRESAADVNWDRVQNDNIPEIATSYWQHPSIDRE